MVSPDHKNDTERRSLDGVRKWPICASPNTAEDKSWKLTR